jgi:hypothetical protein
MALVQRVLFSSGADGTSFTLEYDDVTLQATRALFVVPNTLGAPLTVNAQNPQLNGGVSLAWQAPPRAGGSQYTFDPPLQGTAVVGPHGIHGIDWHFSFISFGSVGSSPRAGSTVIHVGPIT